MRCMEDEDCVPDVRQLDAGEHVARKHHDCVDCPYDRLITPGEHYSRSVLLIDREFTVVRTCLRRTCWQEHDAEDQARRKAHTDQPLEPDDLLF